MERKKGRKVNQILSWITFASCLILTIGVMTIFSACGPKDDGTWMSCHYAQLTVFALGMVMSVLSLLAVFVRGKASVALRILTVLCAIAAAVIPGNVIHLCMMNEMQCRAVMRPSVILLSVIICIFTVLSAVTENKKVS